MAKRELLILRHGKSDWGTGVEDFHRPLKNRGKRAAQRMGVWLWQQELRPDLVISSPAERAINTAHKCCKSMDVPVSSIIKDERIYAASLKALLAVLGDVPKESRRIIVMRRMEGLIFRRPSTRGSQRLERLGGRQVIARRVEAHETHDEVEDLEQVQVGIHAEEHERRRRPHRSGLLDRQHRG